MVSVGQTWTEEEMRSGNRAADNYRRGRGPEPTPDQLAARAAYRRAQWHRLAPTRPPKPRRPRTDAQAAYARDPANHCRPCGRILPRQRPVVADSVPDGMCPGCGRPRRDGPLHGRPPAERVADVVELLPYRGPEDIAAALDMKPSSVAQAMLRAGRPDLARPFAAAAWRARTTTTTQKASA